MAAAAWIFSVGPGSVFYSPFWQMIYFNVPDGTPQEAFTSVRDVAAIGISAAPRTGPHRVARAGASCAPR